MQLRRDEGRLETTLSLSPWQTAGLSPGMAGEEHGDSHLHLSQSHARD